MFGSGSGLSSEANHNFCITIAMALFRDILDFQHEKKHIYVLLLSAPLLLSLYYYHSDQASFQAGLPEYSARDITGIYALYWRFFCLFILLGVIPLGYARFGMKLGFSDIGLGLGDWKAGVRVVALALPLIVTPLMWLAARTPDIAAEYPMLRRLFQEPDLFWRYEIAYVLLYYTAWEFYFRGFLLFTLAREMGATNAILIQTISSCLIHLGKPESETIGSILGGIVFGILAIRTRSIWYVFILHAAVGVLTDFFVLYHGGIRF